MVLLLVAAGIFLRVYRVKELQPFYIDHALDMLVAKHLVEETHPPTVRPFAVGGQNILQNSPLYFQLLAAILRVVQQPINIVYFFSLAGILCIPLAYLLGKEIAGKRLAYIMAGFVAISFPLIGMSRVVWQPNLIPFVTLLNLYLIILAQRRSSLFLLSLSFLVGMVGFELHFAFVPFFVGINLATVAILWERVCLYGRRNILAFVPYLAALTLLARRVLSQRFYDDEQSTQLFSKVFEIDLEKIVRWPEVVQITLQTRFHHSSVFDIYLINLLLLAMALICLLWYARSSAKSGKNNFVPKLLFVLVVTSIIPSFFSAELFPHYLSPYYVIVSLLLALLFYYCSNRGPFVFGLALGFLVFMNAITIYSLNYLFDHQRTTNYEFEQMIHQQIVRDHQARLSDEPLTAANFNAWIIGTHNYQSETGEFGECIDCVTSAQYLLLEETLGEHVVQLSPDPILYNNITPLLTQPKYIYLVCETLHRDGITDQDFYFNQATSFCLPRADIFSNPEVKIHLLQSTPVVSPLGFRHAVIFVLEREHLFTSQ